MTPLQLNVDVRPRIVGANLELYQSVVHSGHDQADDNQDGNEYEQGDHAYPPEFPKRDFIISCAVRGGKAKAFRGVLSVLASSIHLRKHSLRFRDDARRAAGVGSLRQLLSIDSASNPYYTAWLDCQMEVFIVRARIACLLVLSVALPSSLFADFQYTETTKFTGGSMMSMMKLAGTFSKQAREVGAPIVHSVYVKGNRMARNDPDSSEIVDLDKETVTHIDHQKKQYYTITFEQMREQLLEAQREAARQPPPKPQPAQPPPDTTKPPQLNFDVAVRQTGAQKQFSGVETSESILTLTLKATDQQSGQSGTFAMTNDLWLTPEIPGYEEVREFKKRYMQKLGEVYGSAISSMHEVHAAVSRRLHAGWLHAGHSVRWQRRFPNSKAFPSTP